MKEKGKSSENRRSYHKPRVEQVELRPEEAVLGGCKDVLGTSKPGNIAGCINPSSCINEGS